jgi:N utilization substance protein B
MPARHRSRQRALQVLFLWDVRRQPIAEAISSFYETLASEEEDPERAAPDEFMETLVRGASERASDIDRRIMEKSEHWRVDGCPRSTATFCGWRFSK